MNSLADYKVVRDDTFVAYEARPLSLADTDFVELSVALEFQQEIHRLTLREDTVHGLWEVFRIH